MTSKTWPLVTLNLGALVTEICKLILIVQLLSACGHGGGDCTSTMLRGGGTQTTSPCRKPQ